MATDWMDLGHGEWEDEVWMDEGSMKDKECQFLER